MEWELNNAPCGFLLLTKEGNICSINLTLLRLLDYNPDELVGEHVHTLLTSPSQVFFQLYFLPLVNVQRHLEEMYLNFKSKTGKEIPVLINASYEKTGTKSYDIMAVVIPMHKRSEYENQLLIAKKIAEDALTEKNKAFQELKAKQEELLIVNEENQKYKLETQEELKLAKKIQETSLTDQICNEKIETVSHYKASSELSGDIYGFYQVNDHQYGVILLDVMGHGISSAMITMSMQSLFQRMISRGTPSDIVIKELDNHLHNLFLNNEEAWHYCTAIYVLIDTKVRTIEYINAGHPPAVFQGANGKQIELHSTTPPLGSFTGIQFKAQTFNYEVGGRLLLYTDGVSDPLASKHLYSILQNHSSSSMEECKQDILNQLNLDDDDHYKSDDQCFILVDLK